MNSGRRLFRNLLPLAVLLLPAPLRAQLTAFTNANVVDPETKQIAARTILVRDGRIAELREGVPAGFNGTTVDLAGRWVMPGLVDMHTHSFGNAGPANVRQFLGSDATARAALRVGVIGLLDLFSPEDYILGMRDRQRAGTLGGGPAAQIFAAGPCFTATKGHCSEYGVPTRIVNSPADAVREIDALALKKPDVIKLVYDNRTYGTRSLPTVDRPTLEAVVANAKRHGLKTIVHVGTWGDVRDAVNAGAAAVTHTPGPDPLPDDLPALMVRRGTVHIPTLAVQTDFLRILNDRTMLQDSMLVAVTSDSLCAAYGAVTDTATALRGWLAFQRSNMTSNGVAVRRLAEAGVTMITGTDAGNLGVFQGWSVHRELQLLVDAGLSPWDALRAGTTNAAAFLGQPWGVQVGDEATFLVLDASPVQEIRNTRRIHAVVQRGVVVRFATGDTESSPEETFHRLEQGWMDALARKDSVALERYLASEFTIIGAGSTLKDAVGSRADWLAVGLARPFPNHEVKILGVHRVEGVAVVQVILTGKYPPMPWIPKGGVLSFLITDTWVLRDGRWQVLARHSSVPREEL